MFPQFFYFYGFSVRGFEYIVEFDVDDGEGIGVFVLVLKREFPAADARICLFKLF